MSEISLKEIKDCIHEDTNFYKKARKLGKFRACSYSDMGVNEHFKGEHSTFHDLVFNGIPVNKEDGIHEISGGGNYPFYRAYSWSKGGILSDYDDSDSTYLCEITGGRIVGFVEFTDEIYHPEEVGGAKLYLKYSPDTENVYTVEEAPAVEVKLIWVAKRFRGKSIARGLLRQLGVSLDSVSWRMPFSPGGYELCLSETIGSIYVTGFYHEIETRRKLRLFYQ